MTLGSFSLTATAGAAYVAKMDKTGTVLWATSFEAQPDATHSSSSIVAKRVVGWVSLRKPSVIRQLLRSFKKRMGAEVDLSVVSLGAALHVFALHSLPDQAAKDTNAFIAGEWVAEAQGGLGGKGGARNETQAFWLAI